MTVAAAAEVVAQDFSSETIGPAVGVDHQKIARCLDQTVSAIEGAFLSAGDVLSTAVDGVSELITGLNRIAAAIDPEMVEATAEDLRRAAASLHSLPPSLVQRQNALSGLVDMGASLGAPLAEMKRSLGYLRVFAIYVKVAAAGVPQERQQFTDFADEITGCISDGRAHLMALDGDLEALGRSLRMALRVEGEVARHCDELLPATPDAIVSTAAGLATHRNKVADAAKRVAALATAVRAKVGGVLAALQIGDITRQRLEHVREGLDLLDSVGADLTTEQRARIVALGRDLLNAQLVSASEDFNCEVEMIGRNMEGLAADASEILTLLESAYGRDDQAEGGFLSRLQAHVGDARGLVDQVRNADQNAASLGASVAEGALGLIGRIDDIHRLQVDVQHLALNTRLKCSQIGSEGRSLAVIALELREQAGHLEVAAAQALSVLRTFERGAEDMVRAVAASSETGATAAAAALNGVMARLESSTDNLDGDQRSLAKLGDTVVRDFRKAASGLDLKVVVAANIEEALLAMAARRDDLQPCSKDIAAPVTEFFSGLAKRYTMAQERNVHQVVAAALAVEFDAPPVPQEPAVESLDDLLF
jgi:hypothetical protein